MITTFCLFRGGGGGEAALPPAYQPTGGVECDPAVAAVCDAALPGPPTWMADVRAVDWAQVPPHDIGLASPPCTRASIANPQRGETAEDRALGQAVGAYLEACRPGAFLLENVRGYRTFAAYKGIVDTLLRLGYCVQEHIINAADWGVPQTRTRLILRARRAGGLPPLVPTHARVGDWFHAPWNGWYGAVADLLPDCPPDKLAPWQEARLTRYGDRYGLAALLLPATQSGRGGTAIRPALSPSRTVTGRDRDNTSLLHAVLVDCQNNGRADAGGGPRGLTLREARLPGFTVAASASHAVARALLPERVVRRLSPRALARLQSFPDPYPLPTGTALATRIIGQAVPPAWAKALVASLGVAV